MAFKERLVMRVLQRDVDQAVCGNSRQCVLACAVKRTYGLDKNAYVAVNERGLAFTYDGIRVLYAMPTSYKREAKYFDTTGEWRLQDRKFTFTKVSEKPLEELTPEQRALSNAARNSRSRTQSKRYGRFV